MKRIKCTSCGVPIHKSAFEDPYICRGCEHDHGVDLERFDYLDGS